MSPVLVGELPATVADVVVYPKSAEDLLAVMRIAVCARVAVTPHGKGTGNYGQSVPLAGGILIDFTRMNRLIDLGEGFVTAEAGARVIDLPRHSRHTHTVAEVTAVVEAAGGRVEAVRQGIPAMVRLPRTSYNHPSWFLIRSQPGGWFHVEVSGDALVDRYNSVKKVFPGTLVHLEGNRPETHGMVTVPFVSREQVYSVIDGRDALGVGFHNPHQWYIDRDVDALRAAATISDPYGLLNPGRWPGPDTPISSNFDEQARRAPMEGRH